MEMGQNFQASAVLEANRDHDFLAADGTASRAALEMCTAKNVKKSCGGVTRI